MNDITRGDPNFFVRSNAHIDLSNAQVLEPSNGGRIGGVAESMIYAAARFTELFRECLETNMRENIERFDEK